MNPSPRILFAGTPDFAVTPLRTLIENGLAPIAVYTQPDRPAGRGRKLRPSPVKVLAQEHDIPVYQPSNFREAPDVETLQSLQPDLMIVVAYGLILPQVILDIPAHGCWNIHASLLPRWRGAAPIQRAIEAGDEKTGVCIMQMEAGLDTGPVLSRAETLIGEEDTSASLHDRLSSLGAETLLQSIKALVKDRLAEPTPQDHENAVYADKITKAEAELDFSRPAVELARQVRAFNPWPVCWFLRHDKRIRAWNARAEMLSVQQSPGTIVGTGPSGIDIATGEGILRILELQPEGGRRMSAADYLNAHDIS